MTGENPQRIFGLDLLRTVAILIVVLEHSLGLVSGFFPFLNTVTLPDGVDLFFVLSGFLIGGRLFASIAKKDGFDLSTLFHFLQRRWLRTLPNYFLFLTLNIVLIYFALIKGEINSYLFTYFCFLQNLFKPVDFLFWESWSLAVEEWFYLLFPLVLLFLFQVKSKFMPKNKILVAILLFITLPLLYRFFSLNFLVSHVDWDLYYRKLVLTRLDAMGFGLLAAFLKLYYPQHWLTGKNLCFIVGSVALVLFTIYSNELLQHFEFARTFYFSLSAFVVMLLLPKLDSLTNEPLPLKPLAFISRISYSMYLLHIPLFQIVDGNTSVHSAWQAALRYLVYLFLVFLLSFLVYRYFEKPMMHLKKTEY